ncbi:hypothetical protein N878_16370 [Pseudomonas sp. EGD-AK9]|nr:hypothetical protein N878_16370 [Pseudomonas sp. EGD-AK9]
MQQSGRTGWYYRVLEEGGVGAGEHLQLVERAHADWPLSRLSAVLFDKRVESELLRECLALPLVLSWRRTLGGGWSRARSRTGHPACRAGTRPNNVAPAADRRRGKRIRMLLNWTRALICGCPVPAQGAFLGAA